MNADFSHLLERYNMVKERVHDAAKRSGRAPEDVTLIVVSKTFDSDLLRALYDHAKVRHFGESYVQELRDKQEVLPLDIEWHFIGHLQSNKVKYIADSIAMLHTVDRSSLLKELKKRVPEKGLECFMQVNISKDPDKYGLMPEDAREFARRLNDAGMLKLRGLMTIPMATEDHQGEGRRAFAQLRELAHQLQSDGISFTSPQPMLSMGMTADFEIAIEEGATHIRVGSAIFGSRT